VDQVQANHNSLRRSSGWLHLRYLASFRLPNTIITDLRSNFHSHQFWDFYECSAIEVKYISVAHPRANSQVEHANGLILDGLKKRLYDENSKKGGKWINEISSVIWGFIHNQAKPQDSHLCSSYTGLKPYYQLMSCGISSTGDV
jgi:hypothetical protein